jgi:RING finger family protein/2-cysteine adaptor domain-containing protein
MSYQFSVDQCQRWLKNKSINPHTNRKIQQRAVGGVFNHLEKCCRNYGLTGTDGLTGIETPNKPCVICYEEYTNGLMCPAQHTFCKKCVQTVATLALEKDGKISCLDPNCALFFSLEIFDVKLKSKLENVRLLSCLRDCEKCTKCNYAVDLADPSEINNLFICPVCCSNHCRLCNCYERAYFEI